MQSSLRLQYIFTFLIMPLVIMGCVHKKTDLASDGAPPDTQILADDPAVEDIKEGQQNQKYVQEATKIRMPDLCNQITDEGLKQDCINSIIVAEAAKNNDPELCDNIPTKDEVQRCVDNILFNEAGVALDESVCDQISDSEQGEMCKQNVTAMKEMLAEEERVEEVGEEESEL